MRWILKNWTHDFSEGNCFCYQCQKEIKYQKAMICTTPWHLFHPDCFEQFLKNHYRGYDKIYNSVTKKNICADLL